MKTPSSLLLFFLWLFLSSMMTTTKIDEEKDPDYLGSEFENKKKVAEHFTSQYYITPPPPTPGALLDEAAIIGFGYGTGRTASNGDASYDAASPPECSSNCATAYPKGHANRSVNDSIDTKYLKSLITPLSTNGKLYVFPGYYQVHELQLKEHIEIIGLYDSATSKSAVFSGLKSLDDWTPEGVGLWKHAYPYRIASYEGTNTYACKDGSNLCKYAQDLFFNGVLQTQWECAAFVGCGFPPGNGQWFFERVAQPDDTTDNFLLFRSTTNPNDADTRISHIRSAFKDGNKNIKVRNIVFKGYNFRGFVTDDNWEVTDCNFEKNGVTGMGLRGSNVVVSGNYFRENGSTGLEGAMKNSIVKQNKMENNNVSGHKPGWHAGGMKITVSLNSSIERNYVLDNEGPGLWADASCNGIEMHHNLIIETKNVKGLQSKGIQYEMSSGNRTPNKWEIHNNVIKVNGGAAAITSIFVVNSQYIDIYHNTTTRSQNGILIKQDYRGYAGNCANGYPNCISCSQVNSVPPCDNYCISGGIETDDSGDRCMQQVREIKVFYNDVSVEGTDCLVTGLTVEPSSGQTPGEPGGILPSRYYDKSIYKIDLDSNKYTIPGNHCTLLAFKWDWDSITSKTKSLKWEDWNNFVDANSCINTSCSTPCSGSMMMASQSSDQTITPFPNPFKGSLSMSTQEFKNAKVKFKLIDKNGEVHPLPVLAISPEEIRFNTIQIPPGNYVLHVTADGKILKTLHMLKE